MDITIRPYQSGEPSYIAYLQMKSYREQYNFKPVFEFYLLDALKDFVLNHEGSQLWVAQEKGQILGSIAVCKISESSAQLRWFILDKHARGKGLGTKLMETAMAFCRENNYTHIQLWTVSPFETARHLYKKFGFKATEKKENTEWVDGTITEEKWEIQLP